MRLLHDQRGFLSLIELLVVLVVIMVGLYLWLNMGSLGSPGGGAVGNYVPRRGGPTTTPGIAIDQAVSVKCVENLRQVRQALMMWEQQNEGYPGSLADLRLGENALKCPNTGQPYSYDPATGKVKCLTPGHGSF